MQENEFWKRADTTEYILDYLTFCLVKSTCTTAAHKFFLHITCSSVPFFYLLFVQNVDILPQHKWHIISNRFETNNILLTSWPNPFFCCILFPRMYLFRFSVPLLMLQIVGNLYCCCRLLPDWSVSWEALSPSRGGIYTVYIPQL